jgi:hypothetical protein
MRPIQRPILCPRVVEKQNAKRLDELCEHRSVFSGVFRARTHQQLIKMAAVGPSGLPAVVIDNGTGYAISDDLFLLCEASNQRDRVSPKRVLLRVWQF